MVKRAHLSGDYFILEKDGIPIAGIMSAGELEDYLELRDPKAQRAIAESNADVKAGVARPRQARRKTAGRIQKEEYPETIG